MRRPVHHLPPDAVLKTREERERDDERGDAEREPDDRDRRDEGDVRARRRDAAEVAQRDGGLEPQASPARPEERKEDDVPDRVAVGQSIVSRSMPTPSPAVGGMPY